ncbi:spore germination protein [Neobacillus mesonae]|uniref:spore germination protein n=1 Tax=Neobacillus mesonae TaxID=1193713 RepID=UPI002572E1C7|nr:spore germination protein [Neobacillus mesonae]MED4205432.1 spore germination protein [Neobacillus mesonae]
MPANVGPIRIVNMSGGITQFGDSLFISPKDASKSFSGAGGSNTGGIVIVKNGISITNAFDPNVIDQPISGNK